MIASIGSIRSGINRIRLEFKADGQSDRKSTGHSINRIRLEFKDAFAVIFYNDDFVLIESDWNLKLDAANIQRHFSFVLIESDWNLKYKYNVADSTEDWVLIESDWNLKC